MKRKIGLLFFIVYAIMVVFDRVFLKEQETLLLTMNDYDKARIIDPLIKANISYKIVGNAVYVKRKDKNAALTSYYNSNI